MRWLQSWLAAALLGAVLCAPANAAAPQMFQTKTPDVLRGEVVKSDEAPWQVVFIWRTNVSPVDGVFCGGTLVGERWVLTAAHCFYTPGTCDQFKPEKFWIGAGSVDIGAEDLVLKIPKRIVVSPNYDCKTLANDIAMVELTSPVAISARASLLNAGEAAAYLQPSKTVMASGWGLTEDGIPSRQLLKVRLKVAEAKSCRDHFGERYPEGSICAGGWPTDTCSGDSGGPLWVVSGSTMQQLGVVSKGKQCGKSNAPGIYTPVAAHLPWIEDVRKCVPSAHAPNIC